MNKAVKDFIGEYKYKIETHAHSSPASPCGVFEPEEVIRLYAECGYNGIVLTNHLYSYMQSDKESVRQTVKRHADDYERAASESGKYGIKAYYGLEIRFDGHPNDYLIYGIDIADTENIFPYLKESLIKFRSEYQNPSMLLIQAHPCRPGIELAPPNLIDGVEVLNFQPNSNNGNCYAAKFARKVGGVITSGSDFHFPDTQGLGGIYTKYLPKDSKELASLLRNGDYLLDIGGLPLIPEFMI